MSDRLASFFLVQNTLLPTGDYVVIQHTMPYDLELVRIWGNIGASVPPGGALDLLINVTRTRDGLTLARFRDDHYAPPTGMRVVTDSWVFDRKRAPKLLAGEQVTTGLRCAPASNLPPGQGSAFFAVEFIVWKL